MYYTTTRINRLIISLKKTKDFLEKIHIPKPYQLTIEYSGYDGLKYFLKGEKWLRKHGKIAGLLINMLWITCC